METHRIFALPKAAEYNVTLQDLLNGLKGFNRTSKGVDFFTTKDLKWCPHVLLEPIAESMQQSVMKLAMPHQLGLSINARLGKRKDFGPLRSPAFCMQFGIAARMWSGIGRWRT